MILEPVNDQQCLGLLVERARELVRTRMAYDAAARLRSIRNVIVYLQSLPQTDDDGTERVQVIACDVPQRLRFMPSDPNCFERTLAALVLMELIDPKTERVPVSIDEPERHTGIVERPPGGQWQTVDLFPRRNAQYRRRPRRARNNAVQDVMGVVHPVGRGILGIFGLGSVGDRLGRLEQNQGWLKRDEPRPATRAPERGLEAQQQPQHARPATQKEQQARQPPASWRAPERDPELAASHHAPVNPQPFGESGGPEHGDEETAEDASPSRWAAGGSGARSAARGGAGASGNPTAAPAKRFLW
ncbi:MAG: hypothetical protein JWM53_3019 [bacterium]|nr:hypothetical protein [bacterium]